MDLDIKALESKLDAVRDRNSEDPIPRTTSPSLASTSSAALQHHSAFHQEHLTEEEQAQRDKDRERTLNLFWGDESKRRADEERFNREREALRNLAMSGFGICDEYEREASELVAHRAAEDSSRNISREEYTPTWTENDQQALEFKRKKEDYLQLVEKLSVFLDVGVGPESNDALLYRLQNLKTLLHLYDSQWHESFRRLREDADKRKQRIQDPTRNGVNDHNSEVQGIRHNTPGRRRGRHGRPVVNESLGLFDSFKASITAGKRRMGPRRSSISQGASSSGLPLSSDMDAAEPQPSPVHVTPRRSKRIQHPIPNKAKDLPKTASTASRVISKRNVASKLTTGRLARPQGVSKRQPAKITRGRAGKR